MLVIGRLEISEWTTRESEVRTSCDIWAENVINVNTREDGGTPLLEPGGEAQQMGDVLTGGALAVPIEAKLMQWAAVRNPFGAISAPEQSTSYSPGYTYSATSAPTPVCRRRSPGRYCINHRGGQQAAQRHQTRQNFENDHRSPAMRSCWGQH